MMAFEIQAIRRDVEAAGFQLVPKAISGGIRLMRTTFRVIGRICQSIISF
jgi:hypothetical protein